MNRLSYKPGIWSLVLKKYNMSAFYVPLRRIAYLTLGTFDMLLTKKKPLITIFCYHSISNGKWDFSISRKNFKKQIEYLSGKYEFISLNDVYRYLNGKKEIKKPSVVLTFDDGYKDIYEIKNYLKSKGIKPTVFVFSEPKKISRYELDNDLKFLSKTEIKNLKKAGWEIGSHTATHPNMAKLSDEQILREVKYSKKSLQEELGFPIKYIAYPKGKYNERILEVAKKAGYRLGLSMNDGLITPGINPLVLPRIGVDGTHIFHEFKVLPSPRPALFRSVIKKHILN